jgi:hypothetical protein
MMNILYNPGLRGAMNGLTPFHVTITDPFWTPRLAVNAKKAIFHQRKRNSQSISAFPPGII